MSASHGHSICVYTKVDATNYWNPAKKATNLRTSFTRFVIIWWRMKRGGVQDERVEGDEDGKDGDVVDDDSDEGDCMEGRHKFRKHPQVPELAEVV